MSWLTVCLLVFTQLAVSTYACANSTLPGDMASSSVAVPMPVGEMADCDMAAVQQHPVICKAHCLKDAQSADINVPTVHPPLLLVLFLTAPFADATQPLVSALSASPVPAASPPPLRIQYQVFRI